MALKKRGGERPMEINGEPWAWRLVGMEVLLRRPNDTKVLIRLTTMLPNTDHYNLQHDMAKRNFRITPGQIAEFIRINREEILAMKSSEVA